jgi:hypothetical protein
MSDISMTLTLDGKRKVTIAADAVSVDAMQSASAAHTAKRVDSDAGQDADIIIGDARPVVSSAARTHLRNAANAKREDGSIDWTLRAAHMKMAGRFYRVCR